MTNIVLGFCTQLREISLSLEYTPDTASTSQKQSARQSFRAPGERYREEHNPVRQKHNSFWLLQKKNKSLACAPYSRCCGHLLAVLCCRLPINYMSAHLPKHMVVEPRQASCGLRRVTSGVSHLHKVQVDVRTLYPTREVEGHRVGHFLVVQS